MARRQIRTGDAVLALVAEERDVDRREAEPARANEGIVVPEQGERVRVPRRARGARAGHCTGRDRREIEEREVVAARGPGPSGQRGEARHGLAGARDPPRSEGLRESEDAVVEGAASGLRACRARGADEVLPGRVIEGAARERARAGPRRDDGDDRA